MLPSAMRVSLALLLLLNLILTAAVINLGAFAKKGPRYTADDGNKERHERIAPDLTLAARLDALHNLIMERAKDEL